MVTIPVADETCLRCKGGRFLCGLTYCPLIIKSKALIPIRKILPKLKNSYFGPSPPGLFVGRYGYPKVRIGPLGALDYEQIEIIDEPDHWQTKFSLEDIIGFRAKIFRFMGDPQKVTCINSSSSKLIEISQEQVQSSLPVDLEIKFNKTPYLELKFDKFTQPMGARVHINSIQLASTPKINQKIDSVVSDTDINAVNAVTRLYQDQTTVTQIARIFSAGLLGQAKNRRFVPTRWSITAVDDMVGNKLRMKLSNFSEIQQYLVFFNSYLDNDFFILFIPKETWAFDYHEAWKINSAWNPTNFSPMILTDTEGPNGRKYYANNTVGGYYAARLAILEKLNQMRRVATVIGFREVGKGYAIPLGVWAVRENVRQALKNQPKKFITLEKALSFIGKKLTIPIQFYKKKSPILNRKTLDEFF